MSLDLARLGDKLRRYRVQFDASLAEISVATGIAEERLLHLENGEQEPSGDEVLILADYYRCDFRFFVSNEKLASFEQTETLFRMWGKELTRADRWAIQEFLFLCECEQFLTEELGRTTRPFSYTKSGSFYKTHGAEAAAALRVFLGYQDQQVGSNIYRDLRSIGIHVFRRQLSNTSISGLFVRHPVAGSCVLVNYNEDVFRQQFTAGHEAGHAILDTEADVIVSFANWRRGDLSEIRANTFASRFLLPPSLIATLPGVNGWTADDAVNWATRLQVNTDTLINALIDSKVLTDSKGDSIRGGRIPQSAKTDPELPGSLSAGAKARREELLRRGLSTFYVTLCFEAYRTGHISAGRAAEMLLTDQQELPVLASLFGVSLGSDD